MAKKAAPKEPEPTEEPSESMVAPAVEDADDNGSDQVIKENPDKPAESSIAQVEVVDKPEDQHV